MTRLQKSDIIRLAELSSLTFSDQEMDALLVDLQNIISYVSELNSVALTHQPEPQKNNNVFRVDRAAPQPSDDLLAQAPERDGTYFVVPKVVDSTKDAQ